MLNCGDGPNFGKLHPVLSKASQRHEVIDWMRIGNKVGNNGGMEGRISANKPKNNALAENRRLAALYNWSLIADNRVSPDFIDSVDHPP